MACFPGIKTLDAYDFLFDFLFTGGAPRPQIQHQQLATLGLHRADRERHRAATERLR
jgi:hypothetical protein